jgi:hypothetical protein
MHMRNPVECSVEGSRVFPLPSMAFEISNVVSSVAIAIDTKSTARWCPGQIRLRARDARCLCRACSCSPAEFECGARVRVRVRAQEAFGMEPEGLGVHALVVANGPE